MTTLVPPQELAEVTAEPAGRRRERRPRRRRRAGLGWLRRWVSPLLILAAWQVLSSAGILTEDVLASPLQILATATELLADGTLQSATATSIGRVLSGFLIGATAGLVLAVVAGLPHRRGRGGPAHADAAHAAALRADPAVHRVDGHRGDPQDRADRDGRGLPLYLNTFAGIRSVDRKFLEAAHTLNLTCRQRLRP